MKVRSIKQKIHAQKVNMGGHLLDQPLPNEGLSEIDPFLLIHHWHAVVKKDRHPRDLGVGPHPHRGFSPVTFVFKGELQHRDSLGNNEIVREGGTQWLSAGKGITHSERPSAVMARDGGEQEFIQFWVNTPAKHKMAPPFYKALSAEETPLYQEEGLKMGVVAGSYKGVKSAIPIHSPMILLRGEILRGSETFIELPTDFNALLYVLNGEVRIGEESAENKDMIWFHMDGEGFAMKATFDTRFIVLSGTPLDEPKTSYGPFVMNTQTEILQALRDAQMGKMGVLIEEF